MDLVNGAKQINWSWVPSTYLHSMKCSIHQNHVRPAHDVYQFKKKKKRK